MGTFVYISRLGCKLCSSYSQEVNFDKFTYFIEEYLGCKLSAFKIKGNNLKPVENLHKSLIKIERFPTLFFVPNYCMKIQISSLNLARIHGDIFSNSEKLSKWIISVSDKNLHYNIPEDFFMNFNKDSFDIIDKPIDIDDYPDSTQLFIHDLI